MLTHEEALVHARQHLYSRRPPVDWVWVLRPGQRVVNGWFFYYGLEPVRFIRTSAFPQFGGAPGFLVDDEGHVRIVGWQESLKLVPPREDRELFIPETISIKDLAETADVNIYTMALMIRELKNRQRAFAEPSLRRCGQDFEVLWNYSKEIRLTKQDRTRR